MVRRQLRGLSRVATGSVVSVVYIDPRFVAKTPAWRLARFSFFVMESAAFVATRWRRIRMGGPIPVVSLLVSVFHGRIAITGFWIAANGRGRELIR